MSAFVTEPKSFPSSPASTVKVRENPSSFEAISSAFSRSRS